MEIRVATTKYTTVVLNEPRKDTDPMPERSWKQLYQYWLSRHVDGHIPSRADIDPIIDIPHLVRNLILIDARDNFTYRLVGSEVVERHGLNMTGRRSGTSGGNPKAVAEWNAAVDFVSTTLKPRLLVSRIGDQEIARNVMILLPLADAQGRVEMLLAGSFYNEHFKQGTYIHDMETHEV